MKTPNISTVVLTTAVFLYLPQVSAQCLDPDGDGWGWDGENSCVASAPVQGECIDTDPINDGWGWNGVESCQLESTVLDCFDSAPIGDGWGWNGIESCRLEVLVSECYDSPPVGDGWGWNGVESCSLGAPESANFVTRVRIPGVNSIFSYNPVGAQREFFHTYQADLYAQDSGRYGDVFLRDRQSGEIKVLSKGIDGSEADNRSSLNGVSADGNTLLMTSAATNLTNSPGNGVSQLYLYDVPSETFTPISRSSTGVSPWRQINWGYLSNDGSSAVFGTDAGNLVSDDRNDTSDVFIYTQATGTTRRINLGPNGEEANDYSHLHAMSANGEYVLFYSRATNLTEQPTGGSGLYLYDANLDQVSLVPTAGPVSSSARASGVSDDGNKIVYTYQLQATGMYGIALYNRSTGVSQHVYETIGSVARSGSSDNVAITADGRYVAFLSTDPLIAADIEGDSDRSQMYLTDLNTNTTILVSRSASGAGANGYVGSPRFVDGDRFLRFFSEADNLVANDTNSPDIFLYTMPER